MERAIAVEFATSDTIERASLSQLRGPPVPVGPPGHAVQVTWAPVPGATDVEVTSAGAAIAASLATNIVELPVSGDTKARNLTIPGGAQLLSLSLAPLEWVHVVREGDEDKEVNTHLASGEALAAENVRLVVSSPDANGRMTPSFAVPDVGRQGALPPQFSGATYSESVLRLPDFAPRKVQLMLTEELSKRPDEWSATTTACGATLSASLGTLPTDLSLTGSDGAVLWAFPGPLATSVGEVEVDLRAPLQAALATRLKAGQPLDVVLTLRARAASEARFRFNAAGALLRSMPGVLRTELEGTPAPLPLDGPQLATFAPSTVQADVYVTYAGIRVLEGVNDAVPGAGGAGGVIVRDVAATRAVPRAAIGPLPVVRVGIVGRAPEACELSVQLVDFAGGTAGRAYGDPGVVALEPDDTLALHWIDLPEHGPLGDGVAISVRATKGRFYWATGAAPLARLAVRDPDPGGRPLRIGGEPLLSVTTPKLEQKARTLPVNAFRGAAPLFSSDLFLTVEFADLTLRYAR